ncbi:MAG: CHAP domain-containing protein [Eubacterium sp.]|nr:CHAP domain-containing protein [Eubacterium sp.]
MKFPKYKLTDKQIRGVANIVLHEQGTIAGWFAEASQIANRTDIRGDEHATAANLVKVLTSGWYAKGSARFNAGTTNPLVIWIVKKVFCEGLRTLPRYIDEHDCMSDLSTVKTGSTSVKADKSKWKRHKTVIKNKMGSTYTFYDFPGGYNTGVDPFGYTRQAYRDKWGDECYTVLDAMAPADWLKEIAFGEVGYLEKRSNSNLDSKTANAGSNNYTKYGKWMGMNGTYWCASFLSWLFYTAFGNTAGRQLLCGAYSAACETIRQNFIKKKRYHTSSPKAGDVIFFSGTRHSGANHIGFVYKVNGGKVYTVEGNTSGASSVIDNGGGVCEKSYTAGYSRILGYGRPDYSAVCGQPSVTSTASSAAVAVSYYKKYTGKSGSLVDALGDVGVRDRSMTVRKKIAAKNGISSYSGSAAQNTKLLTLLKAGKLIKP